MANSSHKRIVLTLSDKIEILQRLKNAVKASSLCKEFNVAKSTISNIKKTESKIVKYRAEMTGNERNKSKKKTISAAENTVLYNAVYIWFLQQRALGIPIIGPILCEKTLQLNEKLDAQSDFRTSTGWLRNFKRHNGIMFNIQGEKLSANKNAVGTFKKELQEIIREGNYSEEFIYNADETGLNWKSLPRKSLASSIETAAPGFKINKERITIMVCSNASGSHKLNLTVISKSKNP